MARSALDTAGSVVGAAGTGLAYILFAALVIGGIVFDFYVLVNYGLLAFVLLSVVEAVLIPLCFTLLALIGFGIASGICALGRLCGLDWYMD